MRFDFRGGSPYPWWANVDYSPFLAAKIDGREVRLYNECSRDRTYLGFKRYADNGRAYKCSTENAKLVIEHIYPHEGLWIECRRIAEAERMLREIVSWSISYIIAEGYMAPAAPSNPAGYRDMHVVRFRSQEDGVLFKLSWG